MNVDTNDDKANICLHLELAQVGAFFQVRCSNFQRLNLQFLSQQTQNTVRLSCKWSANKCQEE